MAKSSTELITFVINAGNRIHKLLGPGLLQEIYEDCLIYELSKHGISAERQKGMPLKYETLQFDNAYKLDVFVDNALVVGLKPADIPENLYIKYIETYIKLSGFKTGLMVNFHADNFRSSVKVIEKASPKPILPPIQYTESYYNYKKK